MRTTSMRRLLPFIAMVFLGIALLYAFGFLTSSEKKVSAATTYLQEARVLTVQPSMQRGSITGFGQARSRFDVMLTAQVSGNVLEVAREADSGFMVDTDKVLIKIEDIQYKMAIADAKRMLADSKLTLMQEQRQSERARAEWDRAAFEDEPSALALREPQLAAARASIKSAEATLANAENDLRYTRVKTPFTSMVIERLVGPGDVVQIGTPLMRVASIDRVEIRVPLSAQQWSAIATEIGTAVEVLGPDSINKWSGYVLRVEQHKDQDDRQRALVVAVDNPLAQEQPLFIDTFVSVNIPTRNVQNAYRLPATAKSIDGLIWYIDQDDRLAKFKPTSTINLNDEILIVAPEPINDLRVLLRPLANLTAGTRVRPIEVKTKMHEVNSS